MTPFLLGFTDELVKVAVSQAPGAVPREPRPTGARSGAVPTQTLARPQAQSRPTRYRPDLGAMPRITTGIKVPTPKAKGGGGRRGRRAGGRERKPNWGFKSTANIVGTMLREKGSRAAMKAGYRTPIAAKSAPRLHAITQLQQAAKRIKSQQWAKR